MRFSVCNCALPLIFVIKNHFYMDNENGGFFSSSFKLPYSVLSWSYFCLYLQYATHGTMASASSTGASGVIGSSSTGS